MNATAFEFSATGYGEMSKAGSFRVAQTGGKVGSVAGRAVVALENGDWESFVKLYKRSKLKLSMTRHQFTDGKTEVAIGVSYGHATLGAIRLPAGSSATEKWLVQWALDQVGLSI